MTGHPVDDVRFTRPLVRDLRGHVDSFARSMVGDRVEYGAEDAARPAAVAWVYLSVLAVWAEDHGLIGPYLRTTEASPTDRYALVPGAETASGRLARAYAALCAHPSAWSLLDPRYNPHLHDRDRRPSERVCADLVDWWAKDAPSLTYPDPDSGPASITGWLPGDLLQALSDTRRKGNALCQTPWWVCDFIIDRTLLPAAAERHDETLLTIDPCCGTGHFLIRMIDCLWELYTTGSLTSRLAGSSQRVTGWTPINPVEAARRILAGVDGCELDPLTAAVARLRITVTLASLLHTAGALPGPLRLDTIPPWIKPRVVVGDSLMAHKVTAEEYAEFWPEQAAIINLGTLPEAAAAPAALEQLDLFGGAA